MMRFFLKCSLFIILAAFPAFAEDAVVIDGKPLSEERLKLEAIVFARVFERYEQFEKHMINLAYSKANDHGIAKLGIEISEDDIAKAKKAHEASVLKNLKENGVSIQDYVDHVVHEYQKMHRYFKLFLEDKEKATKLIKEENPVINYAVYLRTFLMVEDHKLQLDWYKRLSNATVKTVFYLPDITFERNLQLRKLREKLAKNIQLTDKQKARMKQIVEEYEKIMVMDIIEYSNGERVGFPTGLEGPFDDGHKHHVSLVLSDSIKRGADLPILEKHDAMRNENTVSLSILSATKKEKPTPVEDVTDTALYKQVKAYLKEEKYKKWRYEEASKLVKINKEKVKALFPNMKMD